jgi:hypothetical protein
MAAARFWSVSLYSGESDNGGRPYWEDATNAVMAHAILTAMTAVSSAVSILKEDWERLEAAQTRQLLDMADSQARLVTDLLSDLVRGMPTEVLEALSELTRPRPQG